MSSLANHHNQTASASMSESDHEVENECDSPSNRQNEVCFAKLILLLDLTMLIILEYDA